jgi:hypothetical protein
MHKHVLYFGTVKECLIAETWIRANLEIEEAYIEDSDVIFFAFYTSFELLERQQQIIVDTLKPTSFLSEEM